MKRWSPQATNYLKEHYRDEQLEKISSKLGFSLYAIRNKAWRLGLLKQKGGFKGLSIDMSKFSNIDLSYLAGIVDGEGCLAIEKKASKLFAPVVHITNNDRGLIKWISERLSTNAQNKHFYVNSWPRGNRKISYRFSLYNRKDIHAFLKALLPFLRIKKRHAELLMEFCSIGIKRYWKRGNSHATQRELEIYEEIRNINKRGIN